MPPMVTRAPAENNPIAYGSRSPQWARSGVLTIANALRSLPAGRVDPHLRMVRGWLACPPAYI